MNSEKNIQCQLCDKTFRLPHYLKIHTTSVHSYDKPHSCNICDKSFKVEAYLKKHIKSIHSGIRSYNCKYCDKSFNDPSALGRHHKLHESNNVKSFSCTICDKKFTTNYYLRSHEKFHIAKKYKCSQCPSEIKGKGPFQQHLRSHSMSLKCSLCEKVFKRRDLLKYHVNGFHNMAEKVSCTQCTSTFKSIRYLRKHMTYKHSGKDSKRWNCETCNKYFSQAGSLIVHKRIHTGEKVNCTFCEGSFSHRFDLKRHQAAVHGMGTIVKKYSCTVCSKKFENKTKCNQHSYTHIGLKPFKCNYCDFRMSAKGNLRNHMRTCQYKPNEENKELLYCKLCDYSSVSKINLAQHQKVHQEPSLQCDLCNYKAKYAHHLKNHKETMHLRNIDYSCDLCSFKSIHKRSLQNHRRIHLK